MWQSTAIGWANAGNQASLVESMFEQDKIDILDAIQLQKYAIARRMLHADPTLANAPNGKGDALRYAAFKGDVRMAQLLIEFRANPLLPDENGHSVMDVATKSRLEPMISLLKNAAQGLDRERDGQD